MPWYAVHTKPWQEERAQSRLAERALEAFLPLTLVRRKRRGVVSSRVEPFFPGYLFVAADLTADTWNAIRWTPGVKAILGCGGAPSPVSEEAVALIRRHAGDDGVIKPGAAFEPGDRVRVTDGPMAGLVGILERPASRAGRVRVLVDILRGAAVELEDVDLELAS